MKLMIEQYSALNPKPNQTRSSHPCSIHFNFLTLDVIKLKLFDNNLHTPVDTGEATQKNMC